MRAFAGCSFLPHHAVAQDADLLALQRDHVAIVDIAPMLQAAAVADGAGAEELARMDGLVGETVAPRGGRAAALAFSAGLLS
ncbi:hypothetical protein [Sorangium cellulosum]|uniref:Uncharacterized protein n=1 Tax=Sorangium cellulosum So0157-2 TaxID=1254432 RepID=S4Y2L1_SORCE|nr:hypothetical protein [Sorangium cellulosum]AGP38716.1 hypothetical protein SCE1572_32070 [Sorangium cellulosum So0157-2]